MNTVLSYLFNKHNFFLINCIAQKFPKDVKISKKILNIVINSLLVMFFVVTMLHYLKVVLEQFNIEDAKPHIKSYNNIVKNIL